MKMQKTVKRIKQKMMIQIICEQLKEELQLNLRNRPNNPARIVIESWNIPFAKWRRAMVGLFSGLKNKILAKNSVALPGAKFPTHTPE
jgi:hypothetical protein